jgi:hypothetical protein
MIRPSICPTYRPVQIKGSGAKLARTAIFIRRVSSKSDIRQTTAAYRLRAAGKGFPSRCRGTYDSPGHERGTRAHGPRLGSAVR